jgi:predicted nucleotidyltransferase
MWDMDKTTPDTATFTDIAIYLRTAQARARERRKQLEARRRRATEIAVAAATILKQDYQARRVVLFGSAIHPRRFHSRSDIDLAVWGLDEREYYRAVARLLSLDPSFEVDLVQMEYARPLLRQTILREGVPL